MDETSDAIVEEAMAAVSGYGYVDRYEILSEVARRLTEAAEDSMKMEYLLNE